MSPIRFFKQKLNHPLSLLSLLLLLFHTKSYTDAFSSTVRLPVVHHKCPNSFSSSFTKQQPVILQGLNNSPSCKNAFRTSLITANTPTKQKNRRFYLEASANPNDDNNTPKDDIFDGRTTLALVGGQSLLVVVAVIAALILHTPNYGLGSEFHLDTDAVLAGSVYTLPLFLLAFVLDTVEENVPALQDVTRATQRSVLALLGSTRKPLLALSISIALGLAAGVGEEMLFRGVLQSELASRFGDYVAVVSSSVVFGVLHAVTPLYALLASVASVFFGSIYIASDNLAVPIVCHGLYDVGALLWAHYTVTEMTDEERQEIMKGMRKEKVDIL